MSKKPSEQELQEAIEDEMEELSEEERLKQFEEQLDLNEEYDAPMPQEQFNAHTFLHKAAFNKDFDSLRTSFLSDEELGRPVFSVRFLLEMETLSAYYLDELAKTCEVENKLKKYFRQKILNITDSGMSNEGFVMNLNVTQKKNIERKRYKNQIENLNTKKT